MNRAIMHKTARDSAIIYLIVLAGVGLLEILFVAMLNNFSKELEYLFINKPFIQRMAKMMLGADLGSDLSATGLMTIGFVHPILLALTWSLLLSLCSRVIAGEIEQGTADVIFVLPVSRTSVYASVSAVWALAGLPLCGMVMLGTWLGSRITPMWEPLDFGAFARVIVAFLALYLCVGGASMMVSSFLTRRGLVIAIVLAWLLSSFLLNFLAQLWPLAERISGIGVLHYYRPLEIVRSRQLPIFDIAVLLGAGALCWMLGLWQFRRRDIPAT